MGGGGSHLAEAARTEPEDLAAPKPWNDVLAVVLGLALYAATMLWLHGLLIGVSLA